MADPASLQNLRDIIEPASVGLWPPAAGVWLIVALVLVWVSAGMALLWICRRQNAYRRAGLQALRNICVQPDKPDGRKLAVQELAVLLKRVALTAFDREKVAALSGESWLAFLDATMEGGRFSDAPGNLLAAVSHRPSIAFLDVSDRQIDELFKQAGRWIKQHRSTMPVERSS